VILNFIVYGSPVAQPRQRHTPLMRDGKPVIGRGGRPVVVNYTPKTSPANQWKSDVKTSAVVEARLDGWGLPSGPIRADIAIYFPRPEYMMKKKFADGPIPHTKKPDRDNVEKGILDALKGVVFIDDGQICAGEVRKFYAEKDKGPRAEIRLETLG